MSLFGIDNADGLELPFGLELITGVHGTQREIDFVYQVVGDYIRPSYKGLQKVYHHKSQTNGLNC